MKDYFVHSWVLKKIIELLELNLASIGKLLQRDNMGHPFSHFFGPKRDGNERGNDDLVLGTLVRYRQDQLLATTKTRKTSEKSGSG